jgi:hypothetical protein
LFHHKAMIRNMYVFHTFAIVYYFLELLIIFCHFFFKKEMAINPYPAKVENMVSS